MQQSLIASEPGYSIKDLEVFYADKRTEEVTAAGDSIVVYERWRETQDPALLESIRAYNEVDCRSTQGLRDWLVAAVRPAGLAWPNRKDIASQERDPEARANREEMEREHLRQQFAGAQRGSGRTAGRTVVRADVVPRSARTSRGGGRCSIAPAARPRN